MDWNAKGGKSAIIRDVVAKGYSFRKAEKAVDAVFNAMFDALSVGETVITPIGKLTPKRRKRTKRRVFQRSVDIATRKPAYRIARFQGAYTTIVLKPARGLWLPDQPDVRVLGGPERVQLRWFIHGVTDDGHAVTIPGGEILIAPEPRLEHERTWVIWGVRRIHVSRAEL
jgi:nucleoid DNA-binding protein